MISHENIKVLSWNVRGLNNSISRRILRDLVIREKAYIIFVQETKCKKLTNRYKDSICEETYDWKFVEAQGMSGGIAAIWDNKMFTKVEEDENQNWILLRWKINNVKEQTPQYINGINVYAPQNFAGKRRLWEELTQAIQNRTQEPFCIAGDFNCILNEMEARNCAYRRRDMIPFQSFINDNNLWDLPIANQVFTWFIKSGKCSKLD